MGGGLQRPSAARPPKIHLRSTRPKFRYLLLLASTLALFALFLSGHDIFLFLSIQINISTPRESFPSQWRRGLFGIPSVTMCNCSCGSAAARVCSAAASSGSPWTAAAVIRAAAAESQRLPRNSLLRPHGAQYAHDLFFQIHLLFLRNSLELTRPIHKFMLLNFHLIFTPIII